RIADSSKIYTNLGLVHAAIGEHELAVEQFRKATGADQYLAIAYFQCGVSNFLLERYELALSDFEQTYLYMRGNTTIFNLYSAEVLFNKGLSMIYLGQLEEGLAGMREAERQQMTDAHKVITDAVRDQGDGYTVFSMPMGVLYRPPEKKVKNTAPKNYIGKATLVAAQETQDLFTGFTGI
ncbi:hypothetical protein PUNSTDRAFT_24804, partial [Punctularia strigosozonata HHB-11173 SS5]|uniref:uncharacterized protein n=1 Tax=Punctularia strigosozonata (strain HHB-11173) TaxID=741275 RepID=UPI0004416375